MKYKLNQVPDTLFNEAQAAQYLNFSVRALQKWRGNGAGPRFIKISSRAIRYRRADLDAWTEKRCRNSTSDMGGEKCSRHD